MRGHRSRLGFGEPARVKPRPTDGRSARREAGGKGGGLLRKRRREDEVAILQCLLRLFGKTLRLFVLRSRVGVQLSVIDTAQIASRARELVARIALRSSVTARSIGTEFARRLRRGRRRRRRGRRRGRRRFRPLGFGASRRRTRRSTRRGGYRRGRWSLGLGRRCRCWLLNRCKDAVGRRGDVERRPGWSSCLRLRTSCGCTSTKRKAHCPWHKTANHRLSIRH